MTREDSLAQANVAAGPVNPEDQDVLKLAGDLAGLRASDERQGVGEELDEENVQVMHGVGGGGGKGCSEELAGHLSGAAAQKEDGCTLFVGDLARAIAETDLERAFSMAGTVISVDIKRDRNTGRNLGYGFVQMGSHEEAAQAKQSLQDFEILGRKIRVGWAQRNTTLFVGDLDEAVTTERLREAFRRFGPIVEDQTYVRTGKSGRHGFVKYETRQDAETARRMMNGTRLGAFPLRVVWHHTHTPTPFSAFGGAGGFGYGGSFGPPSPMDRPFSIYVEFDVEVPGTVVTESMLHSVFSPYGEVLSVVLPHGGALFEGEGGTRRGYGFVHFVGTPVGRRCGMEAMRLLHGQSLGGIRLHCSVSKKPNTVHTVPRGVSPMSRTATNTPGWPRPFPGVGEPTAGYGRLAADVSTAAGAAAAGSPPYPGTGYNTDHNQRMWPPVQYPMNTPYPPPGSHYPPYPPYPYYPYYNYPYPSYYGQQQQQQQQYPPHHHQHQPQHHPQQQHPHHHPPPGAFPPPPGPSPTAAMHPPDPMAAGATYQQQQPARQRQGTNPGEGMGQGHRGAGMGAYDYGEHHETYPGTS